MAPGVGRMDATAGNQSVAEQPARPDRRTEHAAARTEQCDPRWPTGRIAAVVFTYSVLGAAVFAGAVIGYPVRQEIGLPFSIGSASPLALGILLWTAVTNLGASTRRHSPGRASVAAGSASMIAAMALGGPAAAAWVALVGTLDLDDLRGRIPWYGLLANQAMQVVPAVAGALVYSAVHDALSHGPEVVSLPAAAACTAVFWLLNFSMGSLLVWARTGRAPTDAFAIPLGSIRNWMVAEAAIGWLGAVCYASAWWSPLVVLVANTATAASLSAGHSSWLLRHHQLTELPNGRGLREHADGLRRGDHDGLCVFYIDLDGFKAVNDRLGHDHGDAVLVEVARRLEASKRDRDFVAHLHGDEFVVLAERIANPIAAESIAARLREAIEAPIVVGTVTTSVGASIGFELLDSAGSLAEAMRMADLQMSIAKEARTAAAGRVRRQALVG